MFIERPFPEQLLSDVRRAVFHPALTMRYYLFEKIRKRNVIVKPAS